MEHRCYRIRKRYWQVNIYVGIGARDGEMGGIRVGLTKTRIYKEAL